MDSRQILRYSVPGSLFLILGSGFFILLELISGVPSGVAVDPFKSVSPAVAVASAVPAGFLSYQAYYLGYGPTVKTARCLRRYLRGQLITVDGGGLALSYLTPELLGDVLRAFRVEYGPEAILEPGATLSIYEVHPLKPEDKRRRHPRRARTQPDPGPGYPLQVLDTDANPAALRDYEFVWHHNWEIVRALRELTALKHDPGVKAQYASVAEIAHALGASRTALVMGWLSATTLALVDMATAARLPDTVALSHVLCGVAFITVLAVVGYWVLYKARQQAFHAALIGLGWGLRSFLLAHPGHLVELLAARASERRELAATRKSTA